MRSTVRAPARAAVANAASVSAVARPGPPGRGVDDHVLDDGPHAGRDPEDDQGQAADERACGIPGHQNRDRRAGHHLGELVAARRRRRPRQLGNEADEGLEQLLGYLCRHLHLDLGHGSTVATGRRRRRPAPAGDREERAAATPLAHQR